MVFPEVKSVHPCPRERGRRHRLTSTVCRASRPSHTVVSAWHPHGMVMAGPVVWRQLQEGRGACNVLSLPPIIFVKSKTGVQAVLQGPVPQPEGRNRDIAFSEALCRRSPLLISLGIIPGDFSGASASKSPPGGDIWEAVQTVLCVSMGVCVCFLSDPHSPRETLLSHEKSLRTLGHTDKPAVTPVWSV